MGICENRKKPDHILISMNLFWRCMLGSGIKPQNAVSCPFLMGLCLFPNQINNHIMNQVTNISKAIITLFVILSSNFLFAQDTTDVKETQFCIVTLTNGTRVSGMLTSQNDESVKVTDPVLGELTILQSNIEVLRVVVTGVEYQFTMSSGKKYRGVVEAQNSTSIVVRTSTLGNITLTNVNIADFSNGVGETVVTRADHGSRYLFAPSAIPLKKGEGYYQNVYFLMNGAHYGLTDRWSLGGGVIFPIGMYGTVKYGREINDKVHVAAGGMFITTFFDLGLGVGCGFGSITFGDRYTNATMTLGYGAVSDNGIWEATNRPIINFSGMARISDNFTLISENYLFPTQETNYTSNGEFTTNNSYYPQLSLGMRIGGGKHSWDVAAMTMGDMANGDFFAIPYLGYSYRFTNNKQ
jgi:hypothetical protein